jgi:ferritin-like metal-binding protein YciE
MAKSETPTRDAVLVKYLNEAYGKEKQLETALKAQIALAKRPSLKKGLQDHLKVTKEQAKGLSKRIKELGGKAHVGNDLPGPEAVSEAVTSVANKAIATAKGPVQALRGTSEADNELRNVRDCYWNEAEEIAHYDVIEAAATELGDKDTAKLAKTYRRQEERMQTFLEREIPKLVKAVIKEEVPAEERRQAAGRRTAASRNGGSARSTAARSRSNRAASSSASTGTRRRAAASSPRGNRGRSSS